MAYKQLLAVPTAAEAAPFLKGAIPLKDGLYDLSSQITDTELLISGIGIPATTYKLTHTLSRQRYRRLVHGGIAGSFVRGLSPGTAVWVQSESFGDLGVKQAEGFQPFVGSELIKADEKPYSNGILLNPSKPPYQGLKPVHGLTVCTITTIEKENQRRHEFFKADVESMEGAAVFYVALMTGLPFAEIRSISNYAGERDKRKWKIAEAVDELYRQLMHYLQT